jgi:hypothetical protein
MQFASIPRIAACADATPAAGGHRNAVSIFYPFGDNSCTYVNSANQFAVVNWFQGQDDGLGS